ncbi:MAG: hypothetical protein HOP34_12830 [Methylococcaceae bacterium]|nr:hypothetical protein [Methylococcaceae bacterium]
MFTPLLDLATMDLNRLPHLSEYIGRRRAEAALDSEERAHIENFLLDERPPQPGIDLYAKRLKDKAITDLDNWIDRHKNFTAEEINLGLTEIVQPWTFRAENAINHLRDIDPRLYLIRVEDANWLCESIGISCMDLDTKIKAFQKGDAKAHDFLNGVAKRWNSERDKRPMFATTELEVEDIVHDGPANWAEQLRDRLGLGHYSPLSGPPHEIVLMRYTVQEVLDSLGDGEAYPAIPTALDSNMSPYFFPSPIPQHNNPYFGHTVNLSLVDKENDYRIGVELLHPRIDYQAEHFFKMGVIARPFAMPLQQARNFHLPWLQLQTEREDFGAPFFGVPA